jgi:hypothetical protein
MSAKKRYLYHQAPKQTLDIVKSKGLYSSLKLLEDKELLELARPNKKEREEWIKLCKKQKNEPFRKGPNCLFKLSPEKLPENHPTNKYDTFVVKIDLNKLIDELPNTKFYGLELKPFISDEEYYKLSKKEQKEADKREHFLTKEELFDLESKSAQELWKFYKPTRKSMYAPNVPHVAVITPSGIIDPKYFSLNTPNL